MQKVVLDTNIIVSALIGKGNPYRIVEVVLDEKIQIFLSDEIIEEYVDVLNRDRFSRFPDFKTNAEIVLNRIVELGTNLKPSRQINLLKDKDDNKFLELAIEAKADFLITGNKRDFTIPKIEDTKIVTPSEYWEHYKP